MQSDWFNEKAQPAEQTPGGAEKRLNTGGETSLKTFGLPCLKRDDRPVRLPAKYVALIAYLRLEPEGGRRSALRRLLWASSLASKNSSLSTALTTLRKHLPPGALPENDDPLVLNVNLPCDVDALARLRSDRSRPAVLNAVERCGSVFLSGLESSMGGGTDGFVRWMMDRRERYAAELVAVLDEECRTSAPAGDAAWVRELAAKASERGLSWPRAQEWIEVAMATAVAASLPETPHVPAAPTSAAPRRWRPARTQFLTLGAVLLISSVLWTAMKQANGTHTCRPGESVAHLIRQVYPPEANLVLKPGEPYTPGWYLKNVGVCAWDTGAHLRRVHAFGPRTLVPGSADRVTTRTVAPDDTLILTVPLRGPQAPGQYGEEWELRGADGTQMQLDSGSYLQLRFRVLPPKLPVCTPSGVHADLLASAFPTARNVMAPGESFVASWTIVNHGSCIWDSRIGLTYQSASATRMSDPNRSTQWITEPISPTSAVTFEVPMSAPTEFGTYRESWTLVTRDGKTLMISDEPTVDMQAEVSDEPVLRATREDCRPGQEVVSWLGSETIQDGSLLSPGATVNKRWTLLNRGDCAWPPGSLLLRFARGEPESFAHPEAESRTNRRVPFAGTYTFAVRFRVPTTPGHYRLHWEIVNRNSSVVMVSHSKTIWADFTIPASDRAIAPR